MKKINNKPSGYIPQANKKPLPKKEKKKVTKVVTFWLLILFMVVTIIGSVLGTTAFIKTANANTLAISFNGSNVYLPVSYNFQRVGFGSEVDSADYNSYIDKDNSVIGLAYLSVKINIEYDNNTGGHKFYFVQPYDLLDSTTEQYYSFPFIWNTINPPVLDYPLPPQFAEYFYASSTPVETFNGVNLGALSYTYISGETNRNKFDLNNYIDINNPLGHTTYFYFISGSNSNDPYTVQYRTFIESYVSSNGQITSDISSVSLSTQIKDGKVYNVIDYTCSNNNVLSFGFRITDKVNSNETFERVSDYPITSEHYNYNSTAIMPYSLFKFDYRRYLFINTESSDYQLGYRDGLMDNQPNIYKEGYDYGFDNGFDSGKSQGYNKGYEEGVADAGNYTFFSLMTSVVDAPLTAVRGMLNFEVLGFNMYEFFTSIVAVSVVCAILKFII